ncbi:MAG TPA: flagellar motor protein MotB [Vicinamibacterales bacterium]|nr:flagellar motor protein MotB [Vicinamibacterales bacterium]
MPRPEVRRKEPGAASASVPVASRRRARFRRAGHSQTSHERWLVSYADFVTLLFAFFVTMYAMSNIDAQKLSAMVGSVQIAFDAKDYQARLQKLGVNQKLPVAGDDVLGRNPKPAGAGGPKGHELDLNEVESALTKELAPAINNKLLDIQRDPRGLVISIREAGSFGMGSADLSNEARGVLDQIGVTLSEIGNHIRIEGFTDDVPIHTARFASNWELSTSRATNVVAYLLAHSQIEPARVSAAGYAEFHPRVPNDSAADRALNRRVDIVILNPTTRQAEEPGKEQAPTHD